MNIKSIILRIVTLAILTSLFFSCRDNVIAPQPNSKGEVSFQFNVSSKGKSKISNRRSGEIATAVVVTIVDQLGDTVYNMEELPLYNFDGTYISKSISLVTGAYQLVEFLVLDQDSNVIYATPKEGTPLEYLVADPLVIDFNIIKDEVTQVIPEVISTAEFTPDNFGYTTFRFEVVPIFHFQIAVMAFNESTQNFELTTAELSVSGDGTALHTTSLGNITNVVAIQDGYSNYTLTIEKTGYLTIDTTFINSVLKTHENNPIEVHLIETGTTSGTFTDSGQNLGIAGSRDIKLVDLDMDGDLDAFIVNTNSEANKIWINDGNGSFTDSGQNLGNSSSKGVDLGDLDGDGDLDAFIVNHFSESNKVWLNDGNGNFSDSGQNIGSSASNSIKLGDLDGDGDLDAFVINNTANKVWINDGNATFSDSGQNLGSSSSDGVAIADLDGDGDLDVIVGNNSSQPNKFWLNSGSGTFTENGQMFPNLETLDVAIADLDGDSDLDAFIANASANKVWFNNGIGNFADSGQNFGSTDSRAVKLRDLDGDGDLDAFIGNNSNHPNKVYLNDGIGNFADNGQSIGSSSTIAIDIGDLNGDGILDAFVANYNQSNKVWFGQP